MPHSIQAYRMLAMGASVVVLIVVAALAMAEDEPQAVSDKPPHGELQRIIKLGEELVNTTSTHPLAKPYIGNALNCTSCHLDAGKDPHAGSFLGVATAYPAWSPREQRVITLEDRVLNCFMRSMNGVRPPNGSEVSVAITTYITSLAQGDAMKMNPDKPLGPRHVRPLQLSPAQANPQSGAELYADQCAYCHGDQGQGGEDGPPVWGDQSYNAGAGLARFEKLAAWLKVAMPLGDPSLTEQEAIDIAAYVNSNPRPEFVLEEHLPKRERLGEYNAASRE